MQHRVYIEWEVRKDGGLRVGKHGHLGTRRVQRRRGGAGYMTVLEGPGHHTKREGIVRTSVPVIMRVGRVSVSRTVPLRCRSFLLL